MHNNNNTLIMESESIISKYINMRNGCLNKTKPSTKRNLFGKPNKKLTDKLFFENQVSSQKLVNNFLNQFEIVGEKENQRMDVCEQNVKKYFSSSSDCSSDFEKCSFTSTSDSSTSNDSSLCSQENYNIMNNNNLVNISNKCDAIRNLIKSSSCNNNQTLITGKISISKWWKNGYFKLSRWSCF